MQDKDESFMREAIALARRGIEAHEGGPFGALIVMHDKIVGRGWNRVVATHDDEGLVGQRANVEAALPHAADAGGEVHVVAGPEQLLGDVAELLAAEVGS